MDESSIRILAEAFKTSARFASIQLNGSTFVAGMIDRHGLIAYINELLPQRLNELTQNELTQNGQVQHGQVPNGECVSALIHMLLSNCSCCLCIDSQTQQVPMEVLTGDSEISCDDLNSAALEQVLDIIGDFGPTRFMSALASKIIDPSLVTSARIGSKTNVFMRDEEGVRLLNKGWLETIALDRFQYDPSDLLQVKSVILTTNVPFCELSLPIAQSTYQNEMQDKDMVNHYIDHEFDALLTTYPNLKQLFIEPAFAKTKLINTLKAKGVHIISKINNANSIAKRVFTAVEANKLKLESLQLNDNIQQDGAKTAVIQAACAGQFTIKDKDGSSCQVSAFYIQDEKQQYVLITSDIELTSAQEIYQSYQAQATTKGFLSDLDIINKTLSDIYLTSEKSRAAFFVVASLAILIMRLIVTELRAYLKKTGIQLRFSGMPPTQNPSWSSLVSKLRFDTPMLLIFSNGEVIVKDSSNPIFELMLQLIPESMKFMDPNTYRKHILRYLDEEHVNELSNIRIKPS